MKINGRFCVSKFDVRKYRECSNKSNGRKKSNYAHYLYDERIGLSEKYGCSNLSAGCLIETSDNYYIVGELAENTSYPGCMQISGGNADNSDTKNDEIEYGKIYFIKKGETNEYLESLENPKRNYLKELLEIDSKN